MLDKMLDKRNLSFWDIVEVQSILNEKADPNNPKWKEVRTIDDFKLAAVLEMAELVESTPWKWWKGGSADLWNVKIELIDMLHFMASNVEMLDAKKEIYKEKVLGFLEDENITKELFVNDDENSGTDRSYALSIIRDIVNKEESYDIINHAMKAGGLEAAEISSIYIAKYTLNEIRWEGGYALNQYKKMKSGYIDENGIQVEAVEDNVFLKELVEQFKTDESMTLNDLRNLVLKKLKEV